MPTDTEAWIDSLRLPRHAHLLRELVAYARRDERVRFIELGCSVARGAGDELSDLDLGIGIDDGAWPGALEDLADGLRAMGEPVDALEHEIDSWAGVPHRRYFVQFADLTQIDLVAMPASTRDGMPPGSVAVYDADGRLAKRSSSRRQRATADEVREWAFEAHVALMNMDKYLRRRSLWEALEQLHQARTLAWRLWAVARDVPFPVFGLTAVLDQDGVGAPPGLEKSVATLSAGALRQAGAALLRVLTDIGPVACARADAAHPDRMATFVARRWGMDEGTSSSP
ncbi:MAG TPA: nucleotidyltransferase domain-containing protein [Candidatus Limnocylindria bacterium]|nr:nucleotidyltransferase domain-containing protein [Candidatus Limnocylindria bacterium]